MNILGKIGKDKVTGFDGLIIAKTTYLYGTPMYGIQPRCCNPKESAPADMQWFEEGRVEVVDHSPRGL